MNKDKLQKLVTVTVALHREIVTKTEHLKELKAHLVEEARRNPNAHFATANGGTRWTAEGNDGCIARVSFPASALISELDGTSDLAAQCRAVAGEAFRKLFAPVKVYHPVDNFRAEAAALLPAAKAVELAALCETEASPRVSFETAREKTNAKAK